jgi:regulator of ribonuclease activity A
MLATADLCDEYGDEVEVAAPLLHDFGGVQAFHGRISTVEVSDDNTSVRQMLEQPGAGQVLVVDGGASTRCALVGDRLAQLAVENGWAGIVVNGCIRDSAAIATMPIGVKALAAMPRKSEKRGPGRHDVAVSFAGVTFTPGHHLYADADGILVAPRALPIT